MELFELLGRISIDGTDNARKAIDNTVQFAKNGADKISDIFSQIGQMSENIFDENKIFSSVKKLESHGNSDDLIFNNKFFDIEGEFDNVKNIYNNTKLLNDTFLSNLLESFSDLSENMASSSQKALSTINIPNDIFDSQTKLLENSQNVSKNYLDLVDKMKNTNSIIKLDGAEEALEQVDKIYDKIKKITSQKSFRFSDFDFNDVEKNFAKSTEKIKNAISKNKLKMPNFNFDEVEKNFSDSIEKFKNMISKNKFKMPNFNFDEVEKSFSNSMERIKNIISKDSFKISDININDVEKNFSDSIDNMKIIISEKMPEVSNLHSKNLEGIYKNFVDKWHKIGHSAFIMISDMTEAVNRGKPFVDSACSSVAASALENLKINASSAGDYIISTLNSGLYSAAGQIYNTASSIASTISNTLSNISVNVSGSYSGSASKPIGHAKGGIVTREHIARVGEDGAEAIIPLEKNTQWIDRVAERINISAGSSDAVIEKLSELNESIKSLKIYIDGKTLVGEIAPQMDRKLGNIARQKRRG